MDGSVPLHQSQELLQGKGGILNDVGQGASFYRQMCGDYKPDDLVAFSLLHLDMAALLSDDNESGPLEG